MNRPTAASDVPPENLEDGCEEDREDGPDLAEIGSGMELDLAATPASLDAGAAVIRRFWTTLPTAPGVYRMIDRAGEVLYVGKAKNLKARVGNYVRGTGHNSRITRMIAETAAMVFVTTATETEALLLEANLIKQLRPRFNVVLRDDKSLPYILLTSEGPAPQVMKHRGSRHRKGFYFGPFASVWAVNRTINALQRAFLLRSCSDSYFENRTRPCLLFQIKRCSGPCTGEIGPDDYAILAGEARAFLSGRSSAVKERLAAEMRQASEDMEFERAARYRDRLAALSAVQSSQGINTQSIEEADVFGIDEQAGGFCVEVFFFRNFQNWGNRAYFPRADRSIGRAEVLASFLAQFYDDKPPPRVILVSDEIEDCALLAEALSVKAGRKVEIQVPKRGERRQLADAASRNAREALARRLSETSSQAKLLASLGSAFGLARAPKRVEVYDNSHIMGTNAVGAMIVAGPTGFMKTHYRTFTMRSEELVPGDDFGMMREMLRRRFARLAKEAPRELLLPVVDGEKSTRASTRPDEGHGIPAGHVEFPGPLPGDADASLDLSPSGSGRGDDPDAFPAWPDLVLIDGGKGQLEAARGILAELGIGGVPLIGIAKGRDRDAGRETFFVPDRPPVRLPPRDPALYFVQRLRDEAHRFAIGAHRAKRKRDLTKSPLDEIPGIGPARKRALLHHFGTLKAIERAALDDLMRAPGVNAATARTVYDHFRPVDGPGKAGPCQAMLSAPDMRRSPAFTLPNLLTYSRVVAVPIVAGLLFWPHDNAARWPALFIFIAAGVTDYFDGYFARAYAQQSVLGRMLDPIADKLLVAACLLMLAADGTVAGWSLWAAIVILCREILVSGLREYLAELKVGVPVSGIAKWKTVLQLVAIGFLIAGPAGEPILPGTTLIGLGLLWAAAALTIYTGWDYMKAGINHVIDRSGP